MVILLVALAMQTPAAGLRLDCTLSDARGSDSGAATQPTRLSITLAGNGRRLQSARVDGPPLFSSTQGLTVFSGRSDGSGGLVIDERQPEPGQLRWTPRLRGQTIELTRGNSRVVLNPSAAQAGSYEGEWVLGPTNMGSNIFMEGSSGAMTCQGSSTGSAGQ